MEELIETIMQVCETADESFLAIIEALCDSLNNG